MTLRFYRINSLFFPLLLRNLSFAAEGNIWNFCFSGIVKASVSFHFLVKAVCCFVQPFKATDPPPGTCSPSKVTVVSLILPPCNVYL